MNTSPIALDIETCAIPEAVAQLPEPTPPGNYRDPSKIADWIAQAKIDQAANAALDPGYSQVVAFTVAKWEPDAIDQSRRQVPPPIDQIETAPITTRTFLATADFTSTTPRENDARLILAALGLITNRQLVTFNGGGFDLPYIRRRAMLLRCGPWPTAIDTNPHHCNSPQHSHADVMLALHGSEIGNGNSNPCKIKRNLHHYAKTLLGIEPDYDTPKDMIGQLWTDGRLDEVAKVCTWDAAVTLRLHALCTHYLS